MHFKTDGQEVAIVITKSQLNTISKFVEVILEKKIESALAIERTSSDQQSSLCRYILTQNILLTKRLLVVLLMLI